MARPLPGRLEVTDLEAAFVDHLLKVCVNAKDGTVAANYPSLVTYFRESLSDFKAGAQWAREHPEMAVVTLARIYPFNEEEDRPNSWENMR